MLGGKEGYLMSKDPVRFTSQWALIGVIMFYTVGTALIARHTKKIFTPASAGGSEYSQYSRISEQANQPEPLVEEHQQINTAGFIPWDSDESNLTLYDVAFGAEQFYQEAAADESEEKSDEEEKKKNAPQELTKIRTKIKCVETILRKAIIEPYCINGQVKGLQICGLEKISQAKALLLNSGDVIVAVNGEALSSKKDAYNIFKRARKSPIMIIDLLQDGEPKKFLLDFQ
jgi:hypothetical protein